MNNKTHYESLAELRGAIIDLFRPLINDIGVFFSAVGDLLIEKAAYQEYKNGLGLVNDACDVLESLTYHKPDISVQAVDEFSEELKAVVLSLDDLE